MFECKVENTSGNIITLTGAESDFQVIQIDGLNPPNATINLTNIAGMDGARYNSAKLETRNIVIYIKLNGNVENNRILLYKYFPTKDWCKLYYKNDRRDVFAECYVQTVEVSPFSESEVMQVSLICPQPYFKDMQEIISDVSKVAAGFQFPFSINVGSPVPVSSYDASRVTVIRNRSETETGVIVEVKVLGDINKILIRNTVTGEHMTINNPVGFRSGDLITISTGRGQKSVTLLRNGVKTNIFSLLQSGFTFFQLAVGENRFSYLIDDGNSDDDVTITFRHRTMYRGV